MALPPILHQGRSLSLRRTAPIDAPILYEKMYANAEFMHLFRLNTTYESIAVLRSSLATRLETPAHETGYLEMLIIHKKYGAIGITFLADYAEEQRRAEFAIGLFDFKQPLVSYALEGSLLIGDLAFNRYNLNRVYTFVYEYNYQSRDSTLEGGFTLEGISRKHVYDLQTESFVDLYNFGMTVGDFRNNQRIARLSKRLVGRDITQPLVNPNQFLFQPQPLTVDHPQFVNSGQRSLSL